MNALKYYFDMGHENLIQSMGNYSIRIFNATKSLRLKDSQSKNSLIINNLEISWCLSALVASLFENLFRQ